jgi:hypothetical protein
MSRVLTFSRTFPKGHPKEGEQTLFVEKIYAALRLELVDEIDLNECLDNYISILTWADVLSKNTDAIKQMLPKYHTIRKGHRFKVGDTFSPRVWSGKPYRSKQIIFAPQVTVKAVFDFKIDPTDPAIVQVKKDGARFYTLHYHLGQATETIAINDGLTLEDFAGWFGDFKKPFDGQIICWTDKLNYG